jgi:hypothetical protein
MSNELARIYKETVVACIEVISHNFPGGTGEFHAKLQWG